MDIIKLYLGMIVAFLAIDSVWLIATKNFYQDRLGHLLATQVNLVPAGIFYALYVYGVMMLVVLPAVNDGSVLKAGLYGALFGLIAYATYDLTNQATLKNWSWLVTGVDLLWGATLTAVVAVIGYYLARWIGIGA